jgi:hypothetical protein
MKPYLLALGWSLVFAAQPPPRYRLIDSGFPANEQFQPYWIDNERIIFKGYEVGSYSKEMHDSPPSVSRAKGYDEHGMRTGYYLWDTKSGKVSLYKDKIENLCAEDDQVIYLTIPSNEMEKYVVWEGKLGEEKPSDIDPQRLPSRGSLWNRNCWPLYPDPKNPQSKGRHLLRLRPPWGYLDLGPINPPFDLTAPVLYYRSGRAEAIKLSIPRSKLRSGKYFFVPHDGRYFLIDSQADRSGIPDAWYLAADGALTEVVIPPGPWLNISLHPVKGGIFLSSSYTKGKKLSEPGGAYLVPDGEWWRLLFTGVKGKSGVSPDGCKVATTIAPDEKAYLESFREWVAGRPGQKTMRMINICQ